MTYAKLRASLKEWESSFQTINGRKPSSKDIRKEAEVYGLYKKYNAAKKAQSRNVEGPHTPVKPKTKNAKNDQKHNDDEADATDDDDTEDDEENLVTELFPTPQCKGKVLGIFDTDLQLFAVPGPPIAGLTSSSLRRASSMLPLTPQKSSPISTRQIYSSSPSTPSSQLASKPETPKSKKTPDYFRRVNLFASFVTNEESDDDAGSYGGIFDESPLIKKRAVKTKSICKLVQEASSLRTLQFEQGDEEEENKKSGDVQEIGETTAEISVSTIESIDNSPTNEDNTNETHTDPSPSSPEIDEPHALVTDPNLENTAPLFATPDPRKRKAPKRQTKKVVMRPVDDKNDQLISSKPTQNYVRLKIQHNKNRNKRFRR